MGKLTTDGPVYDSCLNINSQSGNLAYLLLRGRRCKGEENGETS